ncbi:hypothetical protein FN846DRAFT_892998 [Sphaerosporella brunnea]|uniref:Uncharacterized protein n=1 Tax=Sphaerosporella brunnea TaxID=1250544 RepID=A0A5J5ENA9_9PEZI|nr:hypothetical protein FN846DRAFT_892998 [Sphaerosporella brunnea]
MADMSATYRVFGLARPRTRDVQFHLQLARFIVAQNWFIAYYPRRPGHGTAQQWAVVLTMAFNALRLDLTYPSLFSGVQVVLDGNKLYQFGTAMCSLGMRSQRRRVNPDGVPAALDPQTVLILPAQPLSPGLAHTVEERFVWDYERRDLFFLVERDAFLAAKVRTAVSEMLLDWERWTDGVSARVLTVLDRQVLPVVQPRPPRLLVDHPLADLEIALNYRLNRLWEMLDQLPRSVVAHVTSIVWGVPLQIPVAIANDAPCQLGPEIVQELLLAKQYFDQLCSNFVHQVLDREDVKQAQRRREDTEQAHQ